MTHNQIAYWQLQETKQHNALSRAETERSNRANESLKHDSNVETQRHNTVVESIDQYNAREKSRSNRANEAETHRSNVARENETNRHNLAQEGYADREVSVKEALLPSEIAKNYGSAAGYGSKLLTGLAGALGVGGPLYSLYARKKNKNSDSNSNNSGGGSSSQNKVVTVSTKPSTKVRVIMNPRNEKLTDYVNRRIEEDNAKSNKRSSKQGNLQAGPERGTAAKPVPFVDEALNFALMAGTRAALGPYLGPAASGVAALMPMAAEKIGQLITP